MKKLTPMQKFWRAYERGMKLKNKAFPFLLKDEIRFATDRMCGCPLTFAVEPLDPAPAQNPYDRAPEAFGLSDDDVEEIIGAADNRKGHNPAIRKRLLRVARLKA